MKLFLLRFHRKIKMNELVCVLLHVFNKSYLTLLTLKSKQLFVFAHKIFPYIQDRVIFFTITVSCPSDNLSTCTHRFLSGYIE